MNWQGVATAWRGGWIRALLRDLFKRVLDIAASSGALIVLSPVLVLIAVAEFWFHGWPPVFTQIRPGKHGKPFRLIKFRSMTNERGADGELLPDADRLTAFGRKLRSTSLDELPEFWNVLRGQMTLVGPRPLLMRYLDRYTPEQAKRHDVRPGITGWAAVNGRNAASWEDRFAMDTWYVENRTTRLDLLILLKTVRTVLIREGVSHAGHETMPEFMGTAGT